MRVTKTPKMAPIIRPGYKLRFIAGALPPQDALFVSPPGILRPVENIQEQKRTPLIDAKKAPSVIIENNNIAYSDFLMAVQNGSVSHVTLAPQGHVAMVTLHVPDGTREVRVVFPEDYDILNYLVTNHVHVNIREADIKEQTLLQRLPGISLSVLQVIFQIGFLAMLVNMFMASRNNAGGVFGVTSSRATLFDPTMIDTRFSDVASAENAKRELSEVVDFLKSPDKYTRLGARIPRGVLLYGPPGCGKTLLARSVAGEAGVPFFSTSGSSMVELFVGVAAARIRDMFAKAKEVAPCIIFIDEIDAIGKARSMSLSSGGNDERDQALNQLLTEMDGFDGNHGVIVIAATNRPDILDEALTRPGRFDRRVSVEYPDLKGREEILRVHTRDMPLSKDIDLGTLARNTIGFTGADLRNLCNEAAIYAARVDSENIHGVHFEQSLEKLTMGEKHSTIMVSDQKKRIVAYHEAGHTLLSLLVNDFDKVRKVSITPRGNSGGATYFEPHEDRIDGSLVTREYLENKIVVALGGRVAEELVFGQKKATTGALGDLEVVTAIATDMVCKYGFNEEIGPMHIQEENQNTDTEDEIRLHVERAYTRAMSMMKEQEIYLHRIAEALLEKETLNEQDVVHAMDGIGCLLKNL